ncbi:MAG: AI-2E family transporter [Solirubrobacterales bacterium]|nr:AI-2E family transporter [Solirubrobacterales bacterium]
MSGPGPEDSPPGRPRRARGVIRGRLRRTAGPTAESPDEQVVEFAAGDLGGVLRLPEWLRILGTSAWLTTGVIVLLLGLVWLLSLAHTIVMPLIAAGIVASVGAPLVAWLNRHRLPRALGALLVLLAIVAIVVAMVVAIVGGVAGEAQAVAGNLDGAKQEISGWLQDLGISPGEADSSTTQAGDSGSAAFHTLLDGVAKGIAGLTSLAFFLALTTLALFFLLKDGPQIRGWVERALPVPDTIARASTHRVLQSLRGYFVGVTVVAAWSATIVGIGALVLGVPLVGTIVAVTFVGGFIPYIGAWSAGIFAVLIALGGGGTEEAAGMAVVQLLANGLLQQVVQPFAYGAALGLHPLAVLVVTIAGGALFGAVGLVLAAPLTSAVVRLSGDIARVRAAEAEAAARAPAAAPG